MCDKHFYRLTHIPDPFIPSLRRGLKWLVCLHLSGKEEGHWLLSWGLEFSELKPGFGPHTLAGRGNAGQAQRKWLLASSLLWTKPIFCRNDRTECNLDKNSTEQRWMRPSRYPEPQFTPCCSKYQIPEETHHHPAGCRCGCFPTFCEKCKFLSAWGNGHLVGMFSQQTNRECVCLYV